MNKRQSFPTSPGYAFVFLILNDYVFFLASWGAKTGKGVVNESRDC
jgi:hypothetical protein